MPSGKKRKKKKMNTHKRKKDFVQIVTRKKINNYPKNRLIPK